MHSDPSKTGLTDTQSRVSPPQADHVTNEIGGPATPESNFPDGIELASPWRRFWARTLDLWWESMVGAFLLSFFLSIFSQSWVDFIDTTSTQVLGIIFIPVAFALDSVIYKIFGNTPGKYLLGLSVTSIHLKKLSFTEYLNRNMRIWVFGYGLGLPLVYIFTIFRQYGRVKNLKAASYDEETGNRVRFDKLKAKPIWAFVLIWIAVLGAIVYLQSLSTTWKTKEVVQTQDSWYTWVNPITGNKATINSSWKYSASKNQDQEDIYTFIDKPNNSIVVIGVETFKNHTLNEYVVLYMQAVKKQMFFKDGGTYTQENGQQIWRGEGFVSSKPESILKVEIREMGDDFWRIATVETPPINPSNTNMKELTYQLWGTLP